MGVTGWLLLTNERILFKTNSFESRSFEYTIPLSNLKSIQPVGINWISLNGLRIETTDNRIDKFVLYDWEEWKNQLDIYIAKNGKT